MDALLRRMLDPSIGDLRDVSLCLESRSFPVNEAVGAGEDFPVGFWRVVTIRVRLVEEGHDLDRIERSGQLVVMGRRPDRLRAATLSEAGGRISGGQPPTAHVGRDVLEIPSLRACARASQPARCATSPRNILVDGATPTTVAAALPWARQIGAQVATVCDSSAIESMMTLGVDRAVGRLERDALRGAAPYDLVVDVSGRSSFRRAAPFLREDGVFVIAGRNVTQLLEWVFLWCLALRFVLLDEVSSSDGQRAPHLTDRRASERYSLSW